MTMSISIQRGSERKLRSEHILNASIDLIHQRITLFKKLNAI